MIEIHTQKSAMDLFYYDVLCDGGWTQELSELYDWIADMGKENELDFIINHYFPHGRTLTNTRSSSKTAYLR